MPLLPQHDDGLSHPDQGYSHNGGCSQVWLSSGVQLDHPSTRGETHQVDDGSQQEHIHNQGVSEAHQPFESDLAATQEGTIETGQTLRDSQALLQDSTSVSLHQFSHSTPGKRKRKSNMLRELEAHNKSPEPEPKPQHIPVGSSQPVLSRPKRNSRMIRELEGYNKPPEPDSDPEKEQVRPKTRRSSAALSKTRRKSVLLREIEPHNPSPESDSELEIETNGPLTRSTKKEFLNFVNGKPSSPKKNLNLRALMIAEFSGVKKGTKTFYAEDSSNLRPSSFQGQQKFRKEVDFGDDEEDEEDGLWNAVRTFGRSRPQPSPTHRTAAWQAEKSMRDDLLQQKLAAESLWLKWNKQKGQSKLCYFPFR